MRFAAGSFVLALAVLAGGCSTWRCRGFIDARDKPVAAPSGRYALESIEFLNLAPRNKERREKSPSLAWLSEQDALSGTSYLDDIAKAAGLSGAAGDAVPVRIRIVPIDEKTEGWNSVFWPLCGTLGVFPAHFVEEMPFDVIVSFDGARAFSYATVGLVRTDRQCGLSRFDMDAPPAAPGAAGESRDEGTIGTGRGIRPERVREVFVKTVAAAVRRAVAEREHGVCAQTPQPATEFGPVAFPEASAAERKATPGFGLPAPALPPPAKPVAAPPPPPRKAAVDDAAFLRAAWDAPRTAEEKRLKNMVESGFMTRADWEARIRRLHGTGAAR